MGIFGSKSSEAVKSISENSAKSTAAISRYASAPFVTASDPISEKEDKILDHLPNVVRGRIEQERIDMIGEAFRDINQRFNIAKKTGTVQHDQTLDDWVAQNPDNKYASGMTFAQLVEWLDLLEIMQKKPENRTDADNAALQAHRDCIERDLQTPEMQSHIQEVANALQNSLLFYQYFFLQNGFNKFWDKRKALRAGISEEVYEQEHAAIMSEYNSRNPTVQLILTDIDGHETNTFYRFFINSLTKFGANHAALQVGPFIIDWNTSEVVFPRDLRSRNITLRLPYNLPDDATSESVFKAVSEIAVRFNSDIKYAQMNMSETHKNCHGLVEAIVKRIKATPSWHPGGPVEQFLDDAVKCHFTTTKFFIRDGKNKVEITNLRDLRKFWDETRYSLDGPDWRRNELKQIVKSIERCFRFQLSAAEAKQDAKRIDQICPDGDRTQIIETSDAQVQQRGSNVTGQINVASNMSRLASGSGTASSRASQQLRETLQDMVNVFNSVAEIEAQNM